MRETLRKAKPQRFEDLIALNALYRPGPLRGGVVDDFIKRRHGKVKISYEVPELEPILADSYGVIAYQEQVMRIASDLGGFTMGEADVLRKAMGKKDAKVMEAQRSQFVAGATDRSIPKKTATKIFDLMEYFAGYGFNKSHSTAYALLAYHTAYLKANYPWHFMAALLTIERQNTDKLALYLGECRDMNVPILAPDLNTSDVHFTVTDEGVRYGLAAIKNVGESAIASIIESRQEGGRLSSLNRMCENVDLRLVNKRVLESLVKAGALDFMLPDASIDSVGQGRAQLLAAVDPSIEHGSRRQRNRDQGQTELFGESDAEGTGAILLPDAPPLTETEQLAFEKEALGFYLSGHPVDRFADGLRSAGVKRIEELVTSEASIPIAGIISQCRLLTTRKGAPMAVVMLEDRGGSLEAVIFPDTYAKYRSLVEIDRLVVARGKLEKDDESARLVVSEIKAVETVLGGSSRVMAVHLTTPPHDRQTVEALAELFGRHRGTDRVSLDLELRNALQPVMVTADLSQIRIRPSETLIAEVERLCGKGSVSWV